MEMHLMKTNLLLRFPQISNLIMAPINRNYPFFRDQKWFIFAQVSLNFEG